jgi:hypothetical protein
MFVRLRGSQKICSSESERFFRSSLQPLHISCSKQEKRLVLQELRRRIFKISLQKGELSILQRSLKFFTKLLDVRESASSSNFIHLNSSALSSKQGDGAALPKLP